MAFCCLFQICQTIPQSHRNDEQFMVQSENILKSKYLRFLFSYVSMSSTS